MVDFQKNQYETSDAPRTHASPTEIGPESGVKRGLKTRHLSMMALAGIIGPGLLVGSGGALSSGGPTALLIGFGVIGIIAFSIMQSLGEVTTSTLAEGDLPLLRIVLLAKHLAWLLHGTTSLLYKKFLFPGPSNY